MLWWKVRKLTSELKSTSPTVREQALRQLADLGGTKALHMIRSALADTSPSVRLAAVEVLDVSAHPE